jgi:hypothetical protein
MYLTLPGSCSVVYYYAICKNFSHIFTPEKIICGMTNPTTANCAGSLIAKLITYLSILPTLNPWKLVGYIVYIIEFLAGNYNRS